MSLYEARAEIPIASVAAIEELLLEREEERWSVLEDVIVKRAWIVGIFDSEKDANTASAELLKALPVATLSPAAITALKDGDWKDSYKAHFKAWKFGRLNWVPEWERSTFSPGPGEVVLWLDPGLAFGTGNHETTRLCIEKLIEVTDRLGPGVSKARVVDAGCGSGILALSAALLGYVEIKGFDNDPEAVRISEENAAFNGLRGKVLFSTADLDSGLMAGCADILLANIQADVLLAFREKLLSSVRPGGILILSGILSQELDKVREGFAGKAAGWAIESRVMGEWSALFLTSPQP